MGHASWELAIAQPTVPQSLDELKIHIRDACESVDMQMSSNVWNEIIILNYQWSSY
jgi:hypothetical protein